MSRHNYITLRNQSNRKKPRRISVPSSIADEMHQLRQENKKLKEAVMFFAKYYDGPSDNMLTAEDRVLFAMPELILRQNKQSNL